MPRHRPHASDVLGSEQHLFVMSRDQLIPEIDHSGANEYPHESEMPLQCAAEPSAESEALRDIHQIMLLKLWTEAGKGTKNAQPAGSQDEEAHRIDPMRHAHHPGMLVG